MVTKFFKTCKAAYFPNILWVASSDVIRLSIGETFHIMSSVFSGVIFRSNFYFPTGEVKNCLALNYLNCQG